MKGKIMSFLKISTIAVVLACSAAPAFAQVQPVEKKLSICGGADGGRYQSYAAGIFKAYNDGRPKGKSSAAEILTTGGSYDNIDKLLDSSCHAGMMQYDVLTTVMASRPQVKMNFEVAAKPYDESVHILCPKSSGIYSLSQMVKDAGRFTMIVGSETGGSHFTWQKIASVDQGLSKMPISNRNGLRAINTISEEGELEGADGKKRVACMTWVGAQGAPFMSQDAAGRASKLKLISVDLDAVYQLKGPKGEPLYRYNEQGYKSYPSLFSDWSGAFSSNPKMPVTSAILIFRSDWIDANEADYNRISRIINNDKK